MSPKTRTFVAREPNRIVYCIANWVLAPFLKRFIRLTIQKNLPTDLNPPYIVLCNHISNIDFLITAVAMYPQRVNFVTANLYFKMRMLRWLVTMMGCIPKQQFVSDVLAIRNIKRVIDRGGVIAIYPSGQSSFTGEATYIDPSIAKLLKILQVPVVSLSTRGAHIAFPKWNMSKIRKSKVEATVSLLFGREQIRTLSYDQLYKGVVDGLYFDDYEWQKEARISQNTPRNAEGIDSLLFLCPECEHEFTIAAEGHRLSCSHCKSVFEMDEYGLLHMDCRCLKALDTPTAWYRWQINHYLERMDDSFAYAMEGELNEIDDHNKHIPVGNVTATIRIDGLYLDGSCRGEKISWYIDHALAPVYAQESRTSFDIMINSRLYAFAPAFSPATFKFILLKESIRQYAARGGRVISA